MPLQSIAYASKASSDVSAEQVERLTRDAARFNVEAGVTGVLLFDGQRFVQYFEGPEDGVEAVYGRVLAATSHREIVELGRGRASIRRFPYWAMRLVPVVSDDLRDLIRQDWDGLRRYEANAGSFGSAMVQLAGIVTPQVNS
ncbi:BLUF domain-containing protein [Stenotrophomonas maltophilia]|uniref:BLUF domain-containing protein n=1 Tax=Stenotrophomonas maltophilia TaxID=40324 RepID=UPI002556A2D0|nr:BLUF domain-containing protein [Stenotrophomonas maltophilia]